jgi:isopenicillin-N epimerase
MAANHALALEARDLALTAFGGELPCPDGMVGTMASIPLPKPLPGSPAEGMDCKALHDWLRERGIEAWLHPHPVPLVRLSAQLYNTPDQYRELLHLLGHALHGT